MRSISPMVLPIAGVLLASLHCSCVGAEIRVQGQAGDIHLEAHDATVAEILAVLGDRFALHYRGHTVRVPVIDRGPYVGGREFDLTAATKARLGFGSTGVVMSTR